MIQCPEATTDWQFCLGKPTAWDEPARAQTIIAPRIALGFIHYSLVFGLDHLKMFSCIVCRSGLSKLIFYFFCRVRTPIIQYQTILHLY